MPTPARTISRALYSDFIDPALRRMRGWLPDAPRRPPLAVPVGPSVKIKPARQAYRERATPVRMQPRLEPGGLHQAPQLTHQPAPELPPGASRFKEGVTWFPDVPLAPPSETDPFQLGWKIHDRGEYAAPDMRYVLRRPDGNPFNDRHFATEEGARRAAHHTVNEFRYNPSPEATARKDVKDWMGWEEGTPVGDALTSMLGKYYKTEMGTPGDRLRAHAAMDPSLHFDPRMTEQGHINAVDNSLAVDPHGYFTVPVHGNPKGMTTYMEPHISEPLLAAKPGMARAPVTDPLYHMRSGLDIGDFVGGFVTLLDPEAPDFIPRELRLDPSKLNKFSFPELSERVGRLNVLTAEHEKQLAKTRGTIGHPALTLHHAYEGDPRGMQWHQISLPPQGEGLPPGFEQLPGSERFPFGAQQMSPHGYIYGDTQADLEQQAWARHGEPQLQEALDYESDMLSHCVKDPKQPFCRNIMAGTSKLYSLRDENGKPYVTIETKPGRSNWDLLGSDMIDNESDIADKWNEYKYGYDRPVGSRRHEAGFPDWLQQNYPDTHAANYNNLFHRPDEGIAQIKGKGNVRPERNLQVQPYIQQFVQSRKEPWEYVHDLHNTNLLPLPNQRYIDKNDYKSTIADEGLNDRFQSWDFNAPAFPENPANLTDEDWEQFGHYFRGRYAEGGAVRGPSFAVTHLSPKEEKAYQSWRVTLPKGLQYEGDYDLRGAYKEGAKSDYRGHMTDRYKLRNHPTFSVGSMYSTPEDPGGRWTDDVFWASPANLRYQSPSDLIEYLDKAERDHPVTPVLPIHYDLGAR